MTKIPAGLTSSVKAGDKSFILQTEFIAGNQSGDENIISGRIKTTVAVSGQVVHKLEKPYIGADNEQDPISVAEKALKRQHITVARKVSSQPKEFLQSVSELTVSIEDRLALVPGIKNVEPIDLRNLAEYEHNNSSDNPILRNIPSIKDLVIAVSQNTRLGKLQRMVGIVEDGKYILSGFGGETFLFALHDDADVSEVIAQLEKVKP